MKIVLDIDNVSFNYGKINVLKDINLKVKEEEFIGLIGPNASGKTTLLKLILGLLKPDIGKISLFGASLNKHDEHIGYVPQYVSFNRNFPITVLETVKTGCIKNNPLANKNNRDELVQTAMQTVGVDTIANKSIQTLSGGMLQRVLIARALAAEPKLLILDEPTANVDAKVEEDIFSILKKYNSHMTIMVVSHDIGFISSYVDRVACLNNTLECHSIEGINADLIKDLYADPVKLIHHHH